MSPVNTVLGPVETVDLGFTLSHEHLATNAAGILRTFPELIDRLRFFNCDSSNSI